VKPESTTLFTTACHWTPFWPTCILSTPQSLQSSLILPSHLCICFIYIFQKHRLFWSRHVCGAYENRNCLYVMQMFFWGIKRWLRLICSAAQNKTTNLWERDRQSCCPLTGMEAGLLTTTMSSSMWTMVIGSEVTGTSCLEQTNNAELTRSHTLQEIQELNLYYTVKAQCLHGTATILLFCGGLHNE